MSAFKFGRRGVRASSPSNHQTLRRATQSIIESLENRQLLSAGSLNLATGVNITGPTADTTDAVFKQPDGKVIIAGHHSLNNTIDLVRFNANGDLDSDFGTSGHATLGDNAPVATDLAEDPDGNIYVGSTGGTFGSGDFAVTKLDSLGHIDNSFGGTGTVTVDIQGTDDVLHRMIIQNTGAGDRIVLAGSAVDASGLFTDFAIAKLDLSGNLDGTFGKVVTPLGVASDSAVADVIADGDSLIAGGSSSDGATRMFTLVRYDGAGVLNAGFGAGGIRTVPIGNLGDNSQIVSLANNGGKLLAVGTNTTTGALAMFQGNMQTGQGDATFNNNLGGTFQDLTAPVGITAAGVGGGGIIVADNALNGGVSQTAAIRYVVTGGPSGVLRDLSYGEGAATNGVAFLNYGTPSQDRSAPHVRIAADGSILAGASAVLFPGRDLNLDAQNADATGQPGQIYSIGFTAPDFDLGNAVAVDSSGRILLAGGTFDPSLLERGALVRRLASGLADTSFGIGGVVQFDVGTSLTAVALDGTDILVAGTSANGPFVARVSANGGTVQIFETVPGVTTGSGQVVRLGVDSLHRVVIATNDDSADLVAARFNPDGTLDTSFNGTGFTTIDLETANQGVNAVHTSGDQLGALLVLGDNSILLGGSITGDNNPDGDFAIAKLTAAGVLDTNFDDGSDLTPDGVVTVDLGSGSAEAIKALALTGGRIVAAGATSSSIALVAFSTTGIPDPTATTTFPAIATNEGVTGMAVDASGRILLSATASSNFPDPSQILVARLVSNGSGGYILDSTYGTAGTSVTNYSFDTSSTGLTLQSDGSAVATGITGTNDPGFDMALARFDGDPVVVNNPPVVDPITGPASGLWQTALNFSGTYSDAGDASVHVQSWTVKNSLNVVVATGSSPNFAWTPNAVGTFTVTFTVTDGGNLSGSASKSVSVTSAALTGGVLTIMGSGAINAIHVTKTTTSIRVAVDGQPIQSFPIASVTSIIIQGGDGNDTIDIASGISAPAELHGGIGNDTISVGNGNDTLYGDDGNDSLSAGANDDQLFGGAGNDTLLGGTGNDILRGDAGLDSLDGGGGNDLLYGGDDADTLTGGGGDDILFGEGGNDSLIGSGGSDVFVGGDGNDLLNGGSGRDVLIGGNGADLINGDAGDDLLIAGYTDYDNGNVPANVVKLGAIRSSWVNSHAVDSLLNGHVFDDGVVDSLSGNSGKDWFIANTDGPGVLDITDFNIKQDSKTEL